MDSLFSRIMCGRVYLVEFEIRYYIVFQFKWFSRELKNIELFKFKIIIFSLTVSGNVIYYLV